MTEDNKSGKSLSQQLSEIVAGTATGVGIFTGLAGSVQVTENHNETERPKYSIQYELPSLKDQLEEISGEVQEEKAEENKKEIETAIASENQESPSGSPPPETLDEEARGSIMSTAVNVAAAFTDQQENNEKQEPEISNQHELPSFKDQLEEITDEVQEEKIDENQETEISSSSESNTFESESQGQETSISVESESSDSESESEQDGESGQG